MFNWLPINIFVWLLLSTNTLLLFACIFVVGYIRTRRTTFIEAEQVAFIVSFLLLFVALLPALM